MNTQLLEALAWADIFGTKGSEYLLVVGYFSVITLFWLALTRQSRRRRPARATKRSWFSLPVALSYHRGHTWVGHDGGTRVRVGMDDFAHQLVGKPERIALPEVGDEVKRDEPLLEVHRDGRAVDMLSPVSGKVIAVNQEVMATPDKAGSDPYGEGWLVQVEIPKRRDAFAPLLYGSKAKRWLGDTVNTFTQKVAGSSLGTVLQDGGEPVPGFASEMSPSGRWDEVAAEFFLTTAKHAGGVDESPEGDGD